MSTATARRHWHTQDGFRSWCGPCQYERRLGDARLLFLLVAALLIAGLLIGIGRQVVEEPARRLPVGEVARGDV